MRVQFYRVFCASQQKEARRKLKRNTNTHLICNIRPLV